MVVGAINQDAANAHVAEIAEGVLHRATTGVGMGDASDREGIPPRRGVKLSIPSSSE
jgi:hypothetical protein